MQLLTAQKFKAHIHCLEQRLQRYQVKLAKVTAQESMHEKTVQELHEL